MAVDPLQPDGRPRLWGQQIRTYTLEPGFVAETLNALHSEGAPVADETLDPLEYCQVECLSCPYTAFCNFQERKMAQLKKQGTRANKFN